MALVCDCDCVGLGCVGLIGADLSSVGLSGVDLGSVGLSYVGRSGAGFCSIFPSAEYEQGETSYVG